MKKLVSILLTVGLLTSCTVASDMASMGTVQQLQDDFDIARLNHLELISGYVEQYKEATGTYPFQGVSEFQNYVFIATKEQQQYTNQDAPYSIAITDANIFIDELESKLGREIEMPFDPQRAPVNKPNYYIYMVVGETYFVAVHVHNDYSFAKKLGEYYNKVEVTNSATGNRNGTWFRENLLKNQKFITAKNKVPNSPGYVEQVIERLGGNDAF